MKSVPSRLIVIGGGPAGVELAQVVQRFGDTTAARLASQRLAKMDGEGR